MQDDRSTGDGAASATGNERYAELCRRLRTSDRQAFEAVFRLHRDELLRYVFSIVRDEAPANDLVQDVFVALWGLRASLDPERPLRPYLYRMARNRALRYLRDERSHAEKEAWLGKQTPGHSSDADSPERSVDAGLLADRLRGWIDELPERQREALVLSRYHALSHQEIAETMGVSPRTVNNHIVRALEVLQRRVQAFEPTFLRP